MKEPRVNRSTVYFKLNLLKLLEKYLKDVEIIIGIIIFEELFQKY